MNLLHTNQSVDLGNDRKKFKISSRCYVIPCGEYFKIVISHFKGGSFVFTMVFVHRVPNHASHVNCLSN